MQKEMAALLRANKDNMGYVSTRKRDMGKRQKEFEIELDVKFEAAVAQLRIQRDSAAKAHYVSLRNAFGDLNEEMKELEIWKKSKEEQNEELQRLGTVFTESNASFDLIKTTSKVGNLFHRFTSLKMESDQRQDIKNNAKNFDHIKEQQHNTIAPKIRDKYSERL